MNTQDLRYLKSEKKIQDTIDTMLATGKITTNVTDFSKQAGIYTSTFYDHYNDMVDAYIARNKQVLKELEEYLGDDYQDLELFFYKIFIFIDKHKLYFQGARKNGNYVFFKAFMLNLKKPMLDKWSRYYLNDANKNLRLERAYHNFCFEATCVYDYWQKTDDCRPDKIGSYAKHIVYLADTACQRVDRQGWGF